MNKFKQLLLVSAMGSALALTGCGSSDSDDGTTNTGGTTTGGGTTGGGTTGGGTSGSSEIKTVQATVDSSSAQDLAVATARGIKKAIVNNEQKTTSPFGVAIESPVDKVVNVALEIVKATTSASGITYDGLCEAGSLDYTFSNDGTSFSYIANNCVIGGETMNGSMTYSFSDANYQNYTITYNDFSFSDAYGSYSTNGTVRSTYSADGDSYSISYDDFSTYDSSTGETYSLTGTTYTCTGLTTGNYNCAYADDWTDSSGETYRFESAVVSGDENSGYDVEMVVYDTENGYVSVDTTSSIFYNCSDGSPSAGGITITGAEGTEGSISFDSCTSFTVMVDGVAQTFNWSEI